jgi:DNA repair protein RadC
MRHQRAEQPLRLAGLQAARDFFAGCFAESDASRETLWVAHIDRDSNCLHVSRHDGDAAEADFPLRSIVRDAALLESAGIILAHNHPSGDATPSVSDCSSTRRLTCVADALGCRVVDHLVFAGSNVSSFRQLGLL